MSTLVHLKNLRQVQIHLRHLRNEQNSSAEITTLEKQNLRRVFWEFSTLIAAFVMLEQVKNELIRVINNSP